jgi:hypothetical protein
VADLEAAADTAIVKVNELSSQLGKAQEAFARVQDQLERVAEQLEADWTELAHRASSAAAAAESHVALVAEECRGARTACAELDAAAVTAAGAWRELLEASRADVADLQSHVADAEPRLTGVAERTAADVRQLADDAEAIEAELEQALADAHDFLRDEVASEMRAVEEEIRARTAALQADLAERVPQVLDEVQAAWEEQLGRVEEILEEELAGTRQHAADVVAFSLEECRRGHDEAWHEVESAVGELAGLLAQLTESAHERRRELAELHGDVDRSLDEAVARGEQASRILEQELETMARYDFVRA